MYTNLNVRLLKLNYFLACYTDLTPVLRLTPYGDPLRRDYRYGWQNPRRDEVKQKLRVKAFEQAVRNVLCGREFG